MKTERRPARVGVGIFVTRTDEELVAEILRRKRIRAVLSEDVRVEGVLFLRPESARQIVFAEKETANG